MFAEEFPEDGIECGEVARIVEPDTASHHVLGAITRFIEDGEKILNRLPGLSADIAGNQLAVEERNLTRYEQPAPGFNGARKGQLLSSWCLAAFNAVPLDAHVVAFPCNLENLFYRLTMKIVLLPLLTCQVKFNGQV
jgi:hypothetical protein